MERLNAGAYRQALVALRAGGARSYLEIGFGTGRFLEMLLEASPDCRVAGVDPTPTMVEVARNRRAIRAAGERADLRLGSDADLPWPDRNFDAAVALHSFQFWPDPERSLRDITRVLRRPGRLVLVLRDHSHRAPAWLPNPISRSGRELEGAVQLLRDSGLSVSTPPYAGSSAIIVGTLDS